MMIRQRVTIFGNDLTNQSINFDANQTRLIKNFLFHQFLFNQECNILHSAGSEDKLKVRIKQNADL
jgi:hypothetical protein